MLSWKSYLIRDEGVTAFDDYIASHFERANRNEEGIVFSPWMSGPYPTWGMPALKAGKAAALQGKEKWRSFHLAVMKAFYTDGRDISKDAVLEEIGNEAGLIMDQFLAACRDRTWEDLVYKETRRAQGVFGIRSIPAVVVEDSFLLEGAVSISRYREAIGHVQREDRSKKVMRNA